MSKKLGRNIETRNVETKNIKKKDNNQKRLFSGMAKIFLLNWLISRF